MTVDVADLRILHYPATPLRDVAKPIEAIDDTVAAVAARMLELMHEADGAGLAAPQVGLSWRMFVTKADDRRPDLVYVNPVLGELDPEIAVREEGCLSLPGDGLLARVWQHEIDHLDGVLIIDKMTPMDRIANRKPLKELESAARM
jgi:peptide deformylase